ncbi:MAG: TIGR01212 family radical SAM protein [Tissierellaceae bacterium]|nr:TIGR01212 family radical SAM protein [Tissierellaceae bacterium]
MSNKRYNTLNNELNKIFGGKVIKLSIDGGFSCPNRDGTKGSRGCIFCSEEGSGEFAGSRTMSLSEQVESQKKLISKKWDSDKYIIYFQSFTNTYAPVDSLKKLYYEALELEGVVGIAIATRPDCLDDEVIELLSEINKKTFLWIELGLQTIHEKTTKFIRRGYKLETYDKAIEKLRENNIKIVTHLIIGLPYEAKEDILQSVKHVASTNTWGIKLHSLYIQKDTDLYDYYNKNPFPIMTMDEYISVVVDALELLPKSMIIHRITGDGKKDLLIEPKWSLNKLKVLTSIDKELKIRATFQGKRFDR